MHDQYGSAGSGGDVKAVVKWFNATKGFGFVQPTDGSPDAFLHVSVLEAIGRSELPEGTEIVCSLMNGRKGLQVASISKIESIPAGGAAPRPRSGGFRDRDSGGFGGGYRDRDSGGYGGRGGYDGGGATSTVEGTVKFFNAEKGFGFIVPDDGGKDVFVSARVLERARITTLTPEQRVRVTTRMGQKGPMAETVELA